MPMLRSLPQSIRISDLELHAFHINQPSVEMRPIFLFSLILVPPRDI